MPQAKISAFFKSSPIETYRPSEPSDATLPWEEEEEEEEQKVGGKTSPVTYQRRDPNPNPNSDDNETTVDNSEMEGKKSDGSANPSKGSDRVGKIINKKRSYAQYHLELGQSDFLLHSCPVCGLMYARGDAGDEKVHKAFHKNYSEGIRFKGWRNERVVSAPGTNGDRIVLVLNGDAPAQKRKVQEVTRMMEKELGFSEGRLLHKLCKVYLFIASHRIVGCLVAEPISTAHKVISNSSSSKRFGDNSTKPVSAKSAEADNDLESAHKIMKFGDFYFRREVFKSCATNSTKVDQWDRGAIFCKEEALPAVCGFRAIFVVPSHRRKRIAWHLLDAARQSFCTGETLELSQCAFSPPTSAGKALASSYSNGDTFLIYWADDSAGANVNKELFGGYATNPAACEGHCSILDMLLKAGCSQPACGEALLEASLCGEAEALELLTSQTWQGLKLPHMHLSVQAAEALSM